MSAEPLTLARTVTDKGNLYVRLAAVRAALGATIAKGGTAPAVMGGFKFIEWDDVAEKVGGLLNTNGIVFIPSTREVSISEAGTTSSGKTIWRAVVWIDCLFVNVDDPKDVQSIAWCGVGDDTSDKAVQKAITSATKYALLKLFLLSGDADTDASDVTAAPATDRRNGYPKTGEHSSCLACSREGFTTTSGAPPTFRLNKFGTWQCNGRAEPDGDGERRWLNHPMPLAEGEAFRDPSEIPNA